MRCHAMMTNKWIQKEEEPDKKVEPIRKNSILHDARELLGQITINTPNRVGKRTEGQIKPNTRTAKRIAKENTKKEERQKKKKIIYTYAKEYYNQALRWFDLDDDDPPVKKD